MTPVERIDPQSLMMTPGVEAVIAALTANGAVVRFVGGCVRDAVIGRPGSGDIDLATPDPPGTVIALLEAAGLRALPTGIDHGTVTALADHHPVEVTTLRRDVETDGRHAKVAFTDDWAVDAARRDFTMNALFCDPDGALYDPVGGLDDARAGRLRFVGDPGQRIEEDSLRILRFFRLYAHYGQGPADPAALSACRAKASLVAALSGERVGAEMLKLLTAPDPTRALSLMIENGVMAALLPQITGLGNLAVLCRIDDGDALRRLALLLRHGGAKAVAERLRWSNADRDRLKEITAPALELGADLDPAAQRRALYRLGAGRFIDLAYLAWAETEKPGFDAMVKTARNWRPPALPVGGDDVMALGVESGPRVGRLLAAVEDWWISGDFKADREAALAKLATLAAD
ncbi:MAG: CCA tRNA nucleotidyltransferase [Proteobacteria bacterium]|nr:CCA tRNA nucleotidyltransferase [Pseudomonadota bacterium]